MTGQELRIARINKGMSIRGLARELDMPEQSIRRIEAGGGIRLDRAAKLAEYFDIKVTDLQVIRDELDRAA